MSKPPKVVPKGGKPPPMNTGDKTPTGRGKPGKPFPKFK